MLGAVGGRHLVYAAQRDLERRHRARAFDRRIGPHQAEFDQALLLVEACERDVAARRRGVLQRGNHRAVQRQLEHRPALVVDPGGDALSAHAGFDLERVALEKTAAFMRSDALDHVEQGLQLAAVHAVAIFATERKAVHRGVKRDHAGGVELSGNRETLLGRLAGAHDGGGEPIALAPARDLELRIVDAVVVGELDQLEAGPDDVARLQVDFFLDAEEAQYEGRFGVDLVAHRLAGGAPNREAREADLLAVEHDTGPVLRERQAAEFMLDGRRRRIGVSEIRTRAAAQRERHRAEYSCGQ